MVSEVSTQTKRKKALTICVAVAVVLVVIGALLAVFLTGDRYEPPVIQGVKEQLVVYEDDNIASALLDGVTAVGGADRPGQTFPVQVHIYAEGSNTETQEYRAGTYRLVYDCPDEKSAVPMESVLIVLPADTEGPVITGARDLAVLVGETVSYRNGITVTDNVDETVQLRVDAGQVNLTQPGTYPVTYSATDSRGNTTAVTVTIVVNVPEAPPGITEVPPETPPESIVTPPETIPDVTLEDLDALADRVLAQILTPGMNQTQQAKAIYDYVYSHIRYVGTSDKSSWITGAYIGLTRGRGDCFNYYAASKELLTRAGIPNIDLERVGGTTDHYWQLVDVGTGWHHFDACPHPTGFPVNSFLMTEDAARAYTEFCSSVRQNYYVYDYETCPVTVVGTPVEDTPVEDTPVEDTPAEDAPAEDVPAEDTPTEDVPAEDVPTEDVPAEDVPTEDTPAEDVPTEDTPAEDVPAEDTPAEELIVG